MSLIVRPDTPSGALALGQVAPYSPAREGSRLRQEVDEALEPFLGFHCVQSELARQVEEALGPHLDQGEPPLPYLTDEERSRHVYVLGASGMGKSEFLRHFIQQDLHEGRGLGLFDPNTALITRVLTDLVHYGYPTEKVVYINPADRDWAVGVNPLELPGEPGDDPHLTDTLTGELFAVFAARWGDTSWGPRMADLLHNALYSLADARYTLAELPSLLTNPRFRRACVERTVNPVVRQFWRDEYEPLSDKEQRQWIAPVLNKVREFLRPAALRTILCQTKSTVDLRRVLDDGLVLLVNLNPADVGEANATLLGQLLLAKLQTVAFRRPANSRPWTLYCDEFQDFLSVGSAEKFTKLLAQARKFGLRLVLAHQDLAQIKRQDRHLVPSILTNTEVQIIFASNYGDAKTIAEQIPSGSQEVPDKVTVTMNRGRWQAGKHEPEQYQTIVQRIPYTPDGRPLTTVITVEEWRKPRTWEQVMAGKSHETCFRYVYNGRTYNRLEDIDLRKDACVEDGLWGPGPLIPLSVWLSHPDGLDFWQLLQQCGCVRTYQLGLRCDCISFPFWNFEVKVTTKQAQADWAQAILGFGPREALLRRRGRPVARLRTPDVPQVTVPADHIAQLEERIHKRWARPRKEIEEELLHRLDAFTVEAPADLDDLVVDEGPARVGPTAPRRKRGDRTRPALAPARPQAGQPPQKAPLAPTKDDFFELD